MNFLDQIGDASCIQAEFTRLCIKSYVGLNLIKIGNVKNDLMQLGQCHLTLKVFQNCSVEDYCYRDGEIKISFAEVNHYSSVILINPLPLLVLEVSLQ